MTKLVEYHVIDPRVPEFLGGSKVFTDDVAKLKRRILFEQSGDAEDAENLIIVINEIWTDNDGNFITMRG